MALPADPPRQVTPSAVVEDLVRRAGEGDREAQQALLARYRYFIRRSVRDRLGVGLRAREESSDLEQNVAIEVLLSLPGQEWRGRRAFLAWLRKIAAAEVIDRARYHGAARRERAREVELEDGLGRATASPESWVDEQRRLAELEALLDELPVRQAQAVVLFTQGHSHAEIGEVLGCTPEAARKHVARGRAQLASLRGARRG